ncbi:MAG: hypothetical protein E7255_02855 [Lachnospiraceae bacterium]|nr:hypothetical protein [Lachnospiraceae bacterium]
MRRSLSLTLKMKTKQAKWMYLLLNLAVGGNWGGTQGMDESIYPVQMLVDYVRVYQSREIEKLIQGTY